MPLKKRRRFVLLTSAVFAVGNNFSQRNKCYIHTRHHSSYQKQATNIKKPSFTLLSMMKCLCYHHNERCQSYFRLGLRMGFKLTVFNSIKKYKNENSTQNLFKARLNSILAKVALQRFEKKTLICWLTRLWILKLPMSV